ncbi:15118_t:CDS:2, partial [Cetraspora pellucida]
MTNNLEKSKGTVVEENNMAQSNNDSEPSCGQVNFEANFGRLSLEMLKFLYQGMGVLDVGLKQDLVSRLVSECKEKEESCSGLFGKGKVVNLEDTNLDESGAGSSNERHETNSLEAGAQGLHHFWHVPVEKEKGLVDWDTDETGQVGNMQGVFSSMQQSQPVTPVFIQAHPSVLPTWQQISSQQGLVPMAPALGVSDLNPSFAGQQSEQGVFSQDVFPRQSS